MSAAVITVPAFASARDGVRHFFGTRSHADSLALDVGVPARQSGAQGRGWLLSVKQVHGTDALVLDRPLTESDQFPGGWDALVTDQPGVTVAVRTADCVPVLVHDPRRACCRVDSCRLAGRCGRDCSEDLCADGETDLDRRGRTCESVLDPRPVHAAMKWMIRCSSQLRVGLPDWESVVRDYRGHKARLDLKALIRRQVEGAGCVRTLCFLGQFMYDLP